MSLSKSITINTLSQILGKISVVLFGVLATIVLRRYLGRSFYGDYIYVISLATMFATLADFGSHLIAVREASQQEKKEGQIIANVIILRFLFSLSASGIMLVLIAIPKFAQGLNWPIMTACLIILALSFKNSLTIIFHTKLKLFYFSLMNFLTAFLAFFGTVFLTAINAGKKPTFFVLNLGLANFLAFIFFLPLALRLINLKFKPSKKIIKRIIRQAAPMGGILLLFTLYSKIDTVILKLYQSSEAVGVYGLTYKIHENLNVMAAYLMNSLLPIFSKLAVNKNKRSRFKKLFQTAFNLLLASGALLAGVTFLISPLIIRILTGGFLKKEIFCLRILVLATFFSFLNHLMGYTIIALRKQAKSFYIAGLALGFNLIVNLIFIPIFSFKAAAVNTVLTEGLVLVLSSMVVYKKLAWFPKPASFPKTITDIIKKKGKVFDG